MVLDDLIDSVSSDKEMEKLFVLGAHHRRLIVIYINQNVYCKGSKSRTISLNTHFMVLMKNPRSLSQIICLSRQVFPGKSSLLVDAYQDYENAAFLLGCGSIASGIGRGAPKKQNFSGRRHPGLSKGIKVRHF